MIVTIKELCEALIDDFFFFFDNIAFTDNPDWSGCYCYFYHFEGSDEQWQLRTKAENRYQAEKLIQERKMKGYLAYYNGKPAGWCNVNDKSSFSRLRSSKEIWEEKKQKVCAIVCFVIAVEHRGKGIASQILEQICQDYSKKGYEYVEAYPRKGVLTSAQQYHGPMAMYLKAGFSICKEFSHYDIVRKRLN